MQNLNLSKQKFLLKIQKLNLKMLKLKKTRKILRKFSWIDAKKKPWSGFFTLALKLKAKKLKLKNFRI